MDVEVTWEMRQSPADRLDAREDPELHQTNWDDLHFDY